MDFKKEFGSNKALEETGAWFDIGEGARLKIARAGHKKSLAYTRELLAPHSAQLAFGKLSDEASLAIAIRVMAKHILLDFEGLTDAGKPIAYSEEAASKLLAESEDFREYVSRMSNDRKGFQQKIEEAITKN